MWALDLLILTIKSFGEIEIYPQRIALEQQWKVQEKHVRYWDKFVLCVGT